MGRCAGGEKTLPVAALRGNAGNFNSAPPVSKPWKPSKAQVKAMDRYKAAYKAAYHMEPEIYFDGKWCKIYGLTARVTMARLRELTRQLEYRAA